MPFNFLTPYNAKLKSVNSKTSRSKNSTKPKWVKLYDSRDSKLMPTIILVTSFLLTLVLKIL